MEILRKVEEARRFFGIVNYPGNLFDILNTEEIIEKNKILILNELRPGNSVSKDDAEKSQIIITTIEYLKKSQNYIEYDVEKVEEYSKNFKSIRRRFYGHLLDIEWVRKALQNGDISRESFNNRSYKNKDYGECSCIAVAMTHPKKFFMLPSYHFIQNQKDSKF